jgi:hypothetical protein
VKFAGKSADHSVFLEYYGVFLGYHGVFFGYHSVFLECHSVKGILCRDSLIKMGVGNGSESNSYEII